MRRYMLLLMSAKLPKVLLLLLSLEGIDLAKKLIYGELRSHKQLDVKSSFYC